MFDEAMYRDILNAAHSILRNNGNQLDRQFSEGFMFDHDPSQGAASMRNAQFFFDYVAREAQRMNNGQMVIHSDRQLFDIVGSYITQIFNRWADSQRQGSMGFGSGGGGRPLGFGNSGGGNNFFGNRRGGTGFNLGGSRPAPLGAMMGDLTDPTPQQPSSHPEQMTSAPVNFSHPQQLKETPMVIGYTHNPLDDLPDSNVEFVEGEGPLNWGMEKPKDRSIVMAKHSLLKTGDHRHIINLCEGYERTYLNDPIDVVKDFFRIVPDLFLAEHFIFRVFYNHVEEVDIPTQDFLEVRKKFVDSLNNDKEATIYTAVIKVLNELFHGPRMAIAGYLVNQINRALHLSCGISSDPSLRIKFTQIEDLEELLGTHFESKLLDVPHSRHLITSIVNTAILNSITGYSDVMFTSPSDKTIDVIRTSPAFPFNMMGVYPSKDIIPLAGSNEAEVFYKALEKEQLSKKTFVRSIRSVLITNILGQKALPSISDKPTQINGIIPAQFNRYVIPHVGQFRANSSECPYYDEHILTDNVDESEYTKYLKDPHDYEIEETDRFIEKNSPKVPVDQTLFAIQYKKDPTEFMMALDICTTMDAERNKGYCLFNKRDLDVISIVK